LLTAGTAQGETHFSPPLTSPVFSDFIGLSKIDGVDAQPGDEIAFFDQQGALCGLYVVETAGEYGIVHVYGDDPDTPAIDEGATAGEVLTVTIWDGSKDEELTGAALQLSGGSPPSGSSFVSSPVPPVWQDQAGFVLNIDTAMHFPEPVGTPFVSNYIGNLTILGLPASIGDEMAVYDPDGVLCGRFRVTTLGQYGIIQIYGDDPGTAQIDEGAVDGNELSFVIWDKSAGVEYQGGALTFSAGAPTGSFVASAEPPLWTNDIGYVLDISGQLSLTEIWTNTYDSGLGSDGSYEVAIDGNGNVISAGYQADTAGTNGYAIKYDAAGSEITTESWPIIYDGPLAGASDYFFGVAVDSNNNVIMTGQVNGTTSTPHVAMEVLKYNNAGALLWSKKEYVAAWNGGRDVFVDASDNVYVVGNVFQGWGNPAYHDWALWKYDSAGNPQAGFPIYYDHGNPEDPPPLELAFGVAVDDAENIVVVGRVSISGSDYDWHVRKYDSSGTFIWSDTYNGPAGLTDTAYKVAIDSNGDIVVAGYFNKGDSANADYDWLIIKYAKSDGTRLWTRTFESASGRSETAGAVIVDYLDNVYVGGSERDASDNGHWRLEYLDGTNGALLDSRVWNSFAGGISGLDIRNGVVAVTGSYDNGADNDLRIAVISELAPQYAQTVISGTVFQNDGVTPLTGDSVTVDVFAGDPCTTGNMVGSAMTDTGSGTYAVSGLPPGTFYIKTRNNGNNYVDEWWAATASVPACGEAQAITVAAGRTAADKNFQLDAGATISGKVYRHDGSTPLTGDQISVEVFSGNPCDSWQTIASTATNPADGAYTVVGLPPGTYYLETWNNGHNYVDEWWAATASVLACGAAQAITVAEKETVTGKDFQIDTGATISGILYHVDGVTPITGDQLMVNIFTRDPCTHGWEDLEAVMSDPGSGAYTIVGLPPGNYYLETWNNGSNYVNEYWADPVSELACGDAQALTVTDKETVTGKNFQLDTGAAISGTVYQSDGETPVTGVQIVVNLFTDYPCDPQGNVHPFEWAMTNPVNGTYKFAGLTSGTYYMSTWNNGAGYMDEWWAAPVSVVDCGGSQAILIGAKENLIGKDFQLDTDSDGDKMPDAWETEKGLDPNIDDSGGNPDNDGLTNLQEYQQGTHPNNSDTDTDNMPDGWEVDNNFLSFRKIVL